MTDADLKELKAENAALQAALVELAETSGDTKQSIQFNVDIASKLSKELGKVRAQIVRLEARAANRAKEAAVKSTDAKVRQMADAIVTETLAEISRERDEVLGQLQAVERRILSDIARLDASSAINVSAARSVLMNTIDRYCTGA